MPRKSAASLSIVTPRQPRPRLAPSADAPEPIVKIFGEILRATPADHFKPGDVPLIQAYAEAICLGRLAARELAAHGPVVQGRASAWIIVQEKAHRAIASLAMRLRLSPQHRADSRSAMRKADGPTASVYSLMKDLDDADEE